MQACSDFNLVGAQIFKSFEDVALTSDLERHGWGILAAHAKALKERRGMEFVWCADKTSQVQLSLFRQVWKLQLEPTIPQNNGWLPDLFLRNSKRSQAKFRNTNLQDAESFPDLQNFNVSKKKKL